jgi:hypothetical protein
MARNAKRKTDREVAKSIALNLPDVEIGSHHGTLDIRVRNKIFATFPAGEKALVVKSTADSMDALIKQTPEVFSKAWGQTWLRVDLEQIERDDLEAMLIDAWLLAAPPPLRKMFEEKLTARRPSK